MFALRFSMVLFLFLKFNSFTCETSSTECTGCNDGTTHREIDGTTCSC